MDKMTYFYSNRKLKNRQLFYFAGIFGMLLLAALIAQSWLMAAIIVIVALILWLFFGKIIRQQIVELTFDEAGMKIQRPYLHADELMPLSAVLELAHVPVRKKDALVFKIRNERAKTEQLLLESQGADDFYRFFVFLKEKGANFKTYVMPKDSDLYRKISQYLQEN